MPNQPKTPISNFRLDPKTKADLLAVAEAMQATQTEAVKVAVRAMRRMSVYMRADEPMACPLGEGHTEHIWELTGKPPIMAGIYRCAGQPFSNGYDPYE